MYFASRTSSSPSVALHLVLTPGLCLLDGRLVVKLYRSVISRCLRPYVLVLSSPRPSLLSCPSTPRRCFPPPVISVMAFLAFSRDSSDPPAGMAMAVVWHVFEILSVMFLARGLYSTSIGTSRCMYYPYYSCTNVFYLPTITSTRTFGSCTADVV